MDYCKGTMQGNLLDIMLQCRINIFKLATNLFTALGYIALFLFKTIQRTLHLSSNLTFNNAFDAQIELDDYDTHLLARVLHMIMLRDKNLF